MPSNEEVYLKGRVRLLEGLHADAEASVRSLCDQLQERLDATRSEGAEMAELADEQKARADRLEQSANAWCEAAGQNYGKLLMARDELDAQKAINDGDRAEVARLNDLLVNYKSLHTNQMNHILRLQKIEDTLQRRVSQLAGDRAGAVLVAKDAAANVIEANKRVDEAQAVAVKAVDDLVFQKTVTDSQSALIASLDRDVERYRKALESIAQESNLTGFLRDASEGSFGAATSRINAANRYDKLARIASTANDTLDA